MKPKTPKKTNGAARWSKGISGNPAGRPPGSRNKTTLLVEALLDDEAERIIRKIIDLALGGDLTALRLCMERLAPPRRDRPVQLELPTIDTLPHVSEAMAIVASAIGAGRITPTEGEALSNILAVQKGVIAAGDLERRLERLEENLSTEVAGD